MSYHKNLLRFYRTSWHFRLKESASRQIIFSAGWSLGKVDLDIMNLAPLFENFTSLPSWSQKFLVNAKIAQIACWKAKKIIMVCTSRKVDFRGNVVSTRNSIHGKRTHMIFESMQVNIQGKFNLTASLIARQFKFKAMFHSMQGRNHGF